MRNWKQVSRVAALGLLLGMSACSNPLDKNIPGKISAEKSSILTGPRNPTFENQFAFSAELKNVRVLCEPQIPKNSSKSLGWLNWGHEGDLYTLKVTIEASGSKINDTLYKLTYPLYGNSHPVYLINIDALDSKGDIVSNGTTTISFSEFGGDERAVGTLPNLTSYEINQIDHIEVAWNYN